MIILLSKTVLLSKVMNSKLLSHPRFKNHTPYRNFFETRFSAVERAEGRVGGRDGEDEVDGGVNEEAGRGDETKRRTPGPNDSKTSC